MLLIWGGSAYVTIVDIDTTKGEAVERELTDKGLQ